jgi:NitT/TauT family transport system substrate-binding protein
MLRYLLNKHGLEAGKDVTIDYSFSTHRDLAFAVAAGKAELAVISEPLVSMVMEKNPGVRPIFDFNAEWKSATPGSARCAQTSLLVRSSLAETSPRIVEEFLAAYQDGASWVNLHEKDAARLIVKHGILDNLKVAESSIPRCNIHFERAADVEEDIMKYLSVFYNFNPDLTGGKLPGKTSIQKSSFFYRRE